MDIENRFPCLGDNAPLQTDQVYQRFTIFLTDEDENDLTIEECDEDKVYEVQEDGQPTCSLYKSEYNNNEDVHIKSLIMEKQKRKHKWKYQKRKGDIEHDKEGDEVDTIKRKKLHLNKEKRDNLDDNDTGCNKKRRLAFSCHHCSYISSWKTNLEKHMMAQHTGERPYKCPHCEYSSVHQFQLEKHWNNHHKGAVILCTFCSFTTTEVEVYHKHCGQVHSGQKPHVCRECGRRLVSLSSLELHMFEKHSFICPQHECPHCAYRTVLSENLKNHLEALHKCPECHFWSSSLREVRRHKKKEHRLTFKGIVMKHNTLNTKKKKKKSQEIVDKNSDLLPLEFKFKLPVFPSLGDQKSNNVFDEPSLESKKYFVPPGLTPATTGSSHS